MKKPAWLRGLNHPQTVRNEQMGTGILATKSRRRKQERLCADPNAHLDAVIRDWPGLGRPLLPETELAILSSFLERRTAIRLLPAAT